MKTVLYCRVSTVDQTLDHQRTQALQVGFSPDLMLADHGVSGVSTRLRERPEGRRLFDILREGDTVPFSSSTTVTNSDVSNDPFLKDCQDAKARNPRIFRRFREVHGSQGIVKGGEAENARRIAETCCFTQGH
jgi:Resolvase, N terminal domain